MTGPVVDIHCHTFNGDDLPVRGFVHRVKLRDVPLGGSLSQVVDLIVQRGAPGFHADKARLDRLLGATELESAFELPSLAPAPDVEAQLEREVEDTLADLQARNPELLHRAALELAAAEGGPAGETGAEGLFDVMGTVRRAVTWATLFTKSRLDLAALLVRNFHDEVDLFCPLLVDMGASLGDLAQTTPRQQMVLQEMISRASMKGLLPGAGTARIHPFIGFDPRAEVRARWAGDIETPFDVVRTAVERYGFVGVKVYPPMGWRPTGNRAEGDITPPMATALNRALDDFYGWAEERQVPVTAHCSDSNYAHDVYRDGAFAAPEGWLPVLEAFPKLHLNLGHFGGAHEDEKPDGWPWRIARAAEGTHVFADVGNHEIHDEGLTEAYLAMLERMFEEPATAAMRDRIMYGSDWHMLALLPDADRFLATYREKFRERFGSSATDAFMGGTALRFLGFDDATNQNAQRLRSRYEQYAPERTPPWLASPAPNA